MKLIYGTGNPGKFSMMKEALKELDVELLSLRICRLYRRSRRKRAGRRWKMQGRRRNFITAFLKCLCSPVTAACI